MFCIFFPCHKYNWYWFCVWGLKSFTCYFGCKHLHLFKTPHRNPCCFSCFSCGQADYPWSYLFEKSDCKSRMNERFLGWEKISWLISESVTQFKQLYCIVLSLSGILVYPMWEREYREAPSIVLANICVRQREQRLFEVWEWGLTRTVFLSCSCFLLRRGFVSFDISCIQRNKTRWIFHTFTVNNGLMKQNWPVHSCQSIRLPLEGISVYHDWVLSNLCQVCHMVTCMRTKPDASHIIFTACLLVCKCLSCFLKLF